MRREPAGSGQAGPPGKGQDGGPRKRADEVEPPAELDQRQEEKQKRKDQGRPRDGFFGRNRPAAHRPAEGKHEDNQRQDAGF